ncbi:cytochrome P450 [Rhizophagus irregularis]|uniref:Cytochrome P450 n=1 Tax=Rhizophagus irregularis TaxID=588596 RepID=A0A2N0RYG7_9GLOM|nr:cytochrome P450 [Rhizophagus irregularis]
MSFCGISVRKIINQLVMYHFVFKKEADHKPSKLPGPFPIPIFGNLFQIGEDLVAAVDKFHEKYGDLYEFYVGNKRNVVISRPDLAEKVWGATTVKNTKFIMRTSYSEGVDELGLGTDIVVTTATGKKSEIKGTWENGLIFTESIYIYNESMMFMMLLPPFIRRNIPATILNLLITTNTERDLEKITVGKFDRPLTDDEISSILREVFTGGLDTTSNTLSFVTFYIAKNRDVYLKMRDEVLKVYGTLENPDITLESFDKLKYIEAVINESIRIFPTLSFMARAAIEDVEFDGYVIKADTTVYTNLKVLSNNPKYFKDPEIFNPDRFLNDKNSMEKYTFLPFGYGARMCPGRIWAMVQMKTFLVKFVSTFDIELVDKDSNIKYKYATANRPVNVDLYIKTRK